MRIAHLALWTQKLEEIRDFYVTYFNGQSNEKYVNESKGFESYFVSFGNEVSLEIMRRRDVTDKATSSESIGLCHFAFFVKNKAELLNMTEKFRKDGFSIVGEPRLTGDGFYESVILDPDGNRVELVAETIE